MTYKFTDSPIYQGADYNPLALARMIFAAPVKQVGCGLIDECSGLPIAEADGERDDFEGCTAIMKLRNNEEVAHVLTTENGGIKLEEGVIYRYIPSSVTSNLPLGQLNGQLDIRFPDGRVERFYDITCDVFPDGNR